MIRKEIGETDLQFLLRLQEMDAFLFHGSQNLSIDMLEPRQASSTDNDPEKNQEAVYASKYVGTAVMRAIVDVTHTQGQSEYGMNREVFPDKPPRFILRKTENVILSPGVVYVLERNGFRESKGDSWTIDRPVRPVVIVSVNEEMFRDLGGKVEIV